jgi:hypothetical protein
MNLKTRRSQFTCKITVVLYKSKRAVQVDSGKRDMDGDGVTRWVSYTDEKVDFAKEERVSQKTIKYVNKFRD